MSDRGIYKFLRGISGVEFHRLGPARWAGL